MAQGSDNLALQTPNGIVCPWTWEASTADSLPSQAFGGFVPIARAYNSDRRLLTRVFHRSNSQRRQLTRVPLKYTVPTTASVR